MGVPFSINETQITGTISDPPRRGSSQSSSPVTNLKLMWTGSFVDRATGEVRESKLYVSVACWNGLAEQVAQYQVGDFLFVRGRLQANPWVDQNGMDRYELRINAFSVTLVQPHDPHAQPTPEHDHVPQPQTSARAAPAPRSQPQPQPQTRPAQAARVPAMAASGAAGDEIPF